ncbi:hypothetical protein VIGAN_04217600 [Vigna angularis var. angularis]|uniref:NAB domain-containing protein n=1 Tax=Vigna angularis var. angularis TaxID=157739 RepID=A0A0S3RVX1_PHAAN|nr:protein NETWORKED 3A [Vigna angularis]BAT84734.1 hypothetical protein VIGAN_04217600 [Vigna angularis var. angularis]
MENKDPESWSSAPIYQSQWLQTTISDLDEKLDAMKTILDGDNSPKELMHCEWREDLIEMLEDFGQSYRVLAIAYNQLKLKTSQGTFQSGSLSSSGTSRTICSICNKRATGKLRDKNNQGDECSLEHSNIKIDRSILGFDLSNEQGDECHELLSAGTCSTKLKPERRHIQMEDRMTKFSTTEEKIDDSELNQRTEDPPMISFKCDNLWSTLKYQTKLTQDNLHQLLVLVQRNDEKRETIRRLRLKVETLKTENRALQISLTHSNADSECDQPQTSRAGGRSTGKLFKI